MNAEFSIKLGRWESPIHGADEIAQTAALISIVFGKFVATRAEDDWSRSIRDDVLLSAYPLALWFASSWWRLHWETGSEREGDKPNSWRMAHELPAAGYGFLWPSITFASDGEAIDVVCNPTDAREQEPLRYLTSFHGTVSSATFERTIDNFVELVLARLGVLAIEKSDLHTLWQHIREERADAALSFQRQLEARLGYDPSEGPESLMESLRDLVGRAGEAAVFEVASGVADKDPVHSFGEFLELANSAGVQGKIEAPAPLFSQAAKIFQQNLQPWERGRQLANSARQVFQLGEIPASSSFLSDILGIPQQTLERPPEPRNGTLPIGLTIQEGGEERLKFLFRKRNRLGRRFEAARFLADWVLHNSVDHWFPSTDSRTARQKVQRAFAAEFLCPISLLIEFLHQDFSDDAIEDAGQHFEVSSRTVYSHLVNHRLLSRERIEGDG